MNFKDKCISCNSTENLNTSTQVNVYNNKVEVSICDNCVEKANFPKIISMVKKRYEVLEKIKAAAYKFGYKLVPIGQESKTVHKDKLEAIIPEEPTVNKKTVTRQTSKRDSDGNLVTVTNKAKIDGKDVEITESIESQEVKTATGNNIKIPKKSVGDLGESDIVFVKKSDKDIQNRFKTIRQQSEDGQYSDGYRIKTCPLCSGTKVSMGKTCPKCNGEGEIMI